MLILIANALFEATRPSAQAGPEGFHPLGLLAVERRWPEAGTRQQPSAPGTR